MYQVYVERDPYRDRLNITIYQPRPGGGSVLNNEGVWRDYEEFATIDPTDLPTFSVDGLASRAFVEGVLDFAKRAGWEPPDGPGTTELRNERNWLRTQIEKIVNHATHQPRLGGGAGGGGGGGYAST